VNSIEEFLLYMHRTPMFNPMTGEYFLAYHVIMTGRPSKHLSKGSRVCRICYCTEQFTGWEIPYKAMQYSLCRPKISRA
jgi:hypothetical protein